MMQKNSEILLYNDGFCIKNDGRLGGLSEPRDDDRFAK